MSLSSAVISAVAGYVPEYKLTNAELETMVDTTDEWILSRTGIKERRILKGENLGTSDMAVHVVEELLQKSGTKKEDIDLLICGTVTPDITVADTANTICEKTGLINAYGYDINAACSGFLFSLFTGVQFIKAGTYKKVIVIGADKMSSIINYKDRATCVIFGDGAGGVLLEPSSEDVGVKSAVLKGDGSGREFLYIKTRGSKYPITHESIDNGDHFVHQEGKPVFKAAVKGMSSAIKDLLEKNNMNLEDVDWLVPHQANIRIIDAVSDHLDFPKEKVMVNIHKYGNTTAATIPLCLWDWEQKLKKGDNVVLTSFGGGFTWGAILVKWAY